MPRGGYRVGAGRPRVKSVTPARSKGKPIKSSPDMLPLDYMLAVMRDEGVDEARRDKMAIAAAVYIHEKVSDRKKGKKEQREEAAKASRDVFSGTRSMPKLIVDNG